MSLDKIKIPHQPQWGGHVSMQSYAIGYIGSIFLTFLAFLIVAKKMLTGASLLVVLFGLAMAQSAIQLIYFFNLGKERNPKWNLIAFYFLLLVMAVVLIGSFFIMYNLNYRMM